MMCGPCSAALSHWLDYRLAPAPPQIGKHAEVTS